jgi:hypothetical protein
MENTSNRKMGRINTSSIERIAPLRLGFLEWLICIFITHSKRKRKGDVFEQTFPFRHFG